MIVPTYPDSRVVAATVQERFARHIAAARQQGQQNIAPQPDALTIEAIINAAFWASLRREESYFPKISFAFLPPEQAGQPLTFERPLPFTPVTLARLALLFLRICQRVRSIGSFYARTRTRRSAARRASGFRVVAGVDPVASPILGGAPVL